MNHKEKGRGVKVGINIDSAMITASLGVAVEASGAWLGVGVCGCSQGCSDEVSVHAHVWVVHVHL